MERMRDGENGRLCPSVPLSHRPSVSPSLCPSVPLSLRLSVPLSLLLSVDPVRNSPVRRQQPQLPHQLPPVEAEAVQGAGEDETFQAAVRQAGAADEVGEGAVGAVAVAL